MKNVRGPAAALPSYVQVVDAPGGLLRRLWLYGLLRLTSKGTSFIDADIDAMRVQQRKWDARFARTDPAVRRTLLASAGFAGEWIDCPGGMVWAQGTHEYRPMGAAVIASTDQFRHRDFRQSRKRPRTLDNSFAGFFGSLEEVNVQMRGRVRWKPRATPAHLL